jgi:hypothetical protein
MQCFRRTKSQTDVNSIPGVTLHALKRDLKSNKIWATFAEFPLSLSLIFLNVMLSKPAERCTLNALRWPT